MMMMGLAGHGLTDAGQPLGHGHSHGLGHSHEQTHTGDVVDIGRHAVVADVLPVFAACMMEINSGRVRRRGA